MNANLIVINGRKQFPVLAYCTVVATYIDNSQNLQDIWLYILAYMYMYMLVLEVEFCK